MHKIFKRNEYRNMELDEILQKSKESKSTCIWTLSGEKREIRNRYSLNRQGLVGAINFKSVYVYAQAYVRSLVGPAITFS